MPAAVAGVASAIGPLAFICTGLIAIGMNVSTAAGQCGYEVTIIAGPPCRPPFSGFHPTLGNGINDSGDVVGHYLDCGGETDSAFLWTARSGFTSLVTPPGSSKANAIDGALVVGAIDLSGDGFGSLAFTYENGAFRSLGTMPDGTFSEALAVADGRVVGNWGNVVTGPIHGFLFQGGSLYDLSADLGTPNSRANDINDIGQITGWMGNSVIADGSAYVWEAGGVITLPPAPGGFACNGRAINNAGDVAGVAHFVDAAEGTVERAVAWLDGQVVLLGTLPGFPESFSTDINDCQTIVGTSQSYTARGFIWKSGRMTALNDLIPSELDLNVISALSINNDGQIAGRANSPEGVVAVLLTPTVSSPSDLDGDCTVGVLDFLQLLASWGRCPRGLAACPGDIDDDGAVGVVDLLLLLGDWT